MQSSFIYRHGYQNMYWKLPEDLPRQFCVLKQYRNKFDCWPVHEMLLIRQLKPGQKGNLAPFVRNHLCYLIFALSVMLILADAASFTCRKFTYCKFTLTRASC